MLNLEKILKPSNDITESELEKGFRGMLFDGVASQIMGILTGSVFLVSLALSLGASNSLLGILAAIPPLVQLFQLPSIYIVEKVQNRRLITVLAALGARLPWLLVVMIPFIFKQESALLIIFVAITLNALLGALGGCSWNSWIRDLIPSNRLGKVFSHRMRVTTVAGIVVSLGAGFFVDYWKSSIGLSVEYAYSVLFFLGFVFGLIGIYFISTIPEPKMDKSSEGFSKIVIKPFRDTNFRNLLRFSSAWSFAVNLAAPFFTVYLLTRLELPLTWVIGLGILSEISNFFFLQIWGKFADEYGNKAVLNLATPLFLVCLFLWTFTTLPEKHYFTILLLVLIYILSGVANAGIALASGNVGLKLAPKNKATAYLVALNLTNSFFAGISPIIGGAFVDIFSKYQINLTLNWKGPNWIFQAEALSFESWDFFFIVAILFGLYAIHRLGFVDEEGYIPKEITAKKVLFEFRRELTSFSPFVGMRRMIEIPLVVAKKSNPLVYIKNSRDKLANYHKTQKSKIDEFDK